MESPVVIRTDVLVVGGGTSGCVAALAASQQGVSTLIIENDSALGGTGTRGGIHRYYYGSGGGLQESIDKRTKEIGDLFGGNPTGFHPEAKRILLSQMCLENDVAAIMDATVFGVLLEGNTVAGVTAVTSEGLVEIRAKVTIDCSGNGYLIQMAGGKLRYGRESDGVYHNYSLVPKRIKNGQLAYDNWDAGWVDPFDPWDVSRAFLRGREWIWQAYAEGLHYFGISSLLGVREGGLIDGDYMLSMEDYIEDKPFPDMITVTYAHLDNHGFDTGNESDFTQLWTGVLGLFSKGIWGDVPYGCLLPTGLEQILVAGRSLSVDRDVASGVRMQKDMQKVGEAAGIAAAICVQSGVSPRALNRDALRGQLLERNVIQPKDLQRVTSRNLKFRDGQLADTVVNSEAVGLYMNELIGYFATDERWKAIWLLIHHTHDDDAAASRLIEALESDSLDIQMGSAIVLSYMGKEDAVPVLLRLLAAREPRKFSEHAKCMPFWIASLLMLRLLKRVDGLEEAMLALKEGYAAPYYTFILNYLVAISDLLPAEQQRQLSSGLHTWLDNPALGEDYIMHVARNESLKWSLELQAYCILAKCGDGQARDKCVAYLSDPRGYVRNAALCALRRIDGDAAGTEAGATAGTEAGIEAEAASAAQQEPSAALQQLNQHLNQPPHSHLRLNQPQHQHLHLGEFDVAVVGGSAAGIICAAELALKGYRVVLVEISGCLMNEVTRARQTLLNLSSAEVTSDGSTTTGAIAMFKQELLNAGATNGREIEPVLAQLAADRLMQKAGVSVLFEARYLGMEKTDATAQTTIKLAFKNGEGALKTTQIADCTPTALLLRDCTDISVKAESFHEMIYTATLVHIPNQADQFLKVSSGALILDARIRPGFYPEEAYLDIALPAQPTSNAGISAELQLSAAVTDVMLHLRQEQLIPEGAALGYIADEPWVVPAWSLYSDPGSIAGGNASGQEQESLVVQSQSRPVIGTGVWQTAIRHKATSAARRERSAVVVDQLLLAGREAAELLHAFLNHQATGEHTTEALI
jgi:hypothetical protein